MAVRTGEVYGYFHQPVNVTGIPGTASTPRGVSVLGPDGTEDSGPPGLCVFDPQLNTYGIFTAINIGVLEFNCEQANIDGITEYNLVTVGVNEVKTMFRMVTAVPVTLTDPLVLTLDFQNEDVNDPEKTLVVGDYVLWNDKDASPHTDENPQSPFFGETLRSYEINEVIARDGDQVTLQRHFPTDPRPERAYFETFISPHATGKQLYKLTVKQWPTKVKKGGFLQQGFLINAVGNKIPAEIPGRVDQVWPTKLIAVAMLGMANSHGFGLFTQDALGRFFYVSGDAELNPPMPGFRTLAGQSYIMPEATSDGQATVGENRAVRLKVQDEASLRCIYATVDSPPLGAGISIEVKMRLQGSSIWQVLEALTISSGNTESYPSSNPPAQRRIPYSLEWPTPVLEQDADLDFDILSVGTTSPGTGLKVYVQT